MNAVATTRAWCRASEQLLRGFRAPYGPTPGRFSQTRCISNQRPAIALPIARFAPRWNLHQIRRESSTAVHRPLTDRAEPKQDDSESQEAGDRALRKAQEPAYDMTFTCRQCLHRSSHRVTKQAYHFGTTLITCPGCKNRHLISDHLKIFSDKSITIEDILREKGEFLKKGRLGEDGEIEFYDEANNEVGQRSPPKD